MKTRRYTPGKVIAVIGVISPTLGLVHLHYAERSCKSDDMVAVFRAIRARLGLTSKIAIFLDNARIHISQVTKTSAMDRDIDIKLLYNIPYRCDLQGCERYWLACKTAYRKQVDFYKAMGWTWDQRAMVENVCTGVSDPHIRACAGLGRRAIMTAEPIKPGSQEGG